MCPGLSLYSRLLQETGGGGGGKKKKRSSLNPQNVYFVHAREREWNAREMEESEHSTREMGERTQEKLRERRETASKRDKDERACERDWRESMQKGETP